MDKKYLTFSFHIFVITEVDSCSPLPTIYTFSFVNWLFVSENIQISLKTKEKFKMYGKLQSYLQCTWGGISIPNL